MKQLLPLVLILQPWQQIDALKGYSWRQWSFIFSATQTNSSAHFLPFLHEPLWFWTDSSMCKFIAVSRPVVMSGCQAESSDGFNISNPIDDSDALTANVGSVPSILLSTLAKSLVVACLINHCEMILFCHSFCRVLLVSWSLLGGLVRTALQSKDCFRKPQMGNKLFNYFKWDEGISFQYGLGMKKVFVFLGKGGGVRGRQRREMCFLKIKSAAVLPCVLIGQTLSCPEPLWPWSLNLDSSLKSWYIKDLKGQEVFAQELWDGTLNLSEGKKRKDSCLQL